MVTLNSFLILVTGVEFPYTAIALGAVTFIGRIIYTIGYMRQPKLRVFGGMPVILSLFGMLIMAAVSTSTWAHQVLKSS